MSNRWMKLEEPNSGQTSSTPNFGYEGQTGSGFMFLEMEKDELEGS